MNSEMSEAAVMVRLGVTSRTTMRGLRKQLCAEGDDFIREGAAGQVFYTEAGFNKLHSALAAAGNPKKNEEPAEATQRSSNVAPQQGDPAAFVGGAPHEEVVAKKTAEPGDSIEVTCTRWKFINQHLIEAVDANGSKWFVRVHDNTKYRPGMRMTAKVQRAGHALLLGRGPRYVGRM